MTTWDKATVEDVLGAPVELTKISSDRHDPVVHVCLRREIQRGRLVRRVNERLCTVGKIRSEHTIGHEAVTCAYCIQRLTAEQTRVTERRKTG